MKCRTNYVSNSSSSSFVVSVRNLFSDKPNDFLISQEQINTLLDYGFHWMSGFPTTIVMFPEKIVDDLHDFKTNEHINLYYDVVCNQQDICDVLFAHKIPFISSQDNDNELVIYKGGDYYETFQNLGIQALSLTNSHLYDEWFVDHITRTKPYKKVYLNSDDTVVNNYTTNLLCAYDAVVLDIIKKNFTDDEWSKVIKFVSEIKCSDLLKGLNNNETA